MTERITYFVDVILPLPLGKEYTYRVPYELNDFISLHLRVIVPFGKSKFYTGLISKIHFEAPKTYEAKYVEHVLDQQPIVTPNQLGFWKWIAAYYMAPLGDVMNAGLPSNFKLASETKICLHPDFTQIDDRLSDREHAIIDALLIREELDVKEIAEIASVKNIYPLVKKMIDKGILMTREELSQKFTPKTAHFLLLNDEYEQEEVLEKLIHSFSTNKVNEAKMAVIIKYIELGGYVDKKIYPIKKVLLEKESGYSSTVKTLIKNGVFLQEKLEVSRIVTLKNEMYQLPVLSDKQKISLSEIHASFAQNKITLLHGVTGSGKTAVYIHLIQEQLEKGKQVLFLLPEIALTTQLIQRLKAVFGNFVGVYHSKFNANERVEIWNKVLENDLNNYRIILGARSSLFLPFRDLGLVIVDEEHETSYKQHEPSPRYNGRDMAIVLASGFKANVLLGSATPSIETYFKAKEGKFAYVKLDERFSKVELPLVSVVNLQTARKNGTMVGNLTPEMILEIKSTLEKNEQIILFQNRRGYNPMWICESCMHTPECVNCDTTLNYHKQRNILLCHYCGYQEAPIGTCKNCGSNKLKMHGFGTEKIEDELEILFPEVGIGRMDLDTTRNKNSHAELLQAFDEGSIQILVGTQMVAKGLDFDRVAFVGVLDADMLIYKTDFRAFERAFNLMSQVAGRAGRREKQGKVLIQTANPEHWLIQKVIAHDYDGFAEFEISERRNFHYPPYYKIIRFIFKGKDKFLTEEAAAFFSKQLKAFFFERVLGPEYAIIPRVQNHYILQTTLKIEQEAQIKKVKERLQELTDQFYSVPKYRSIRVICDVDPA